MECTRVLQYFPLSTSAVWIAPNKTSILIYTEKNCPRKNSMNIGKVKFINFFFWISQKREWIYENNKFFVEMVVVGPRVGIHGG